MITGIDRPTAGTVLVGGERIAVVLVLLALFFVRARIGQRDRSRIALRGRSTPATRA
jgi:hypothetical protein